MLPSMYSGITGLKANQKKLDVIGNNIANSSTTAYKAQRIRFQDMVSQSVSQALAPGTLTGGINGKQIGLGVQIAGIDTNTATGNMQTTSRTLDAAIDGSGYFMVAKGELGDTAMLTLTENQGIDTTQESSLSTFFSRDGSFTLDSKGSLLTSDGYRVLGYTLGDAEIDYTVDDPTTQATIQYQDANATDLAANIDGGLVPLVIPDSVTTDNGPIRIKSFSIEKDGVIKAVLGDGSIAALGQIAMASFKNDAGLEKLGKNIYQNSPNSGQPVVRTGLGAETDNGEGYGDMLQGMLEMSNVDLAEQFTDMIVASRAFQANGKIITTGDEILQDLVNLKR